MPTARPTTTPRSVLYRVSRILFNLSRLLTSEGRAQFECDSAGARTGATHAPIEPNFCHVRICRGCSCFRTNVVTSLGSTERRHRHRLDGVVKALAS